MSDVMTEIGGRVGLITLNRARALNALSLGMIRDLTATLLRWRDDPQVLAVAVRGMGRDGPFGVFCAGGDIRFFHRAAISFPLASYHCPILPSHSRVVANIAPAGTFR